MNLFGWYRSLIRNPQYRWLVIVASLIYLISPIDLAPDLLPGFGQIDDVIVVALLFSEVFQSLLGGAPKSTEGPQQTFYTNRQSHTSADPNVKTVDVKAVDIEDR